VRILRGAYSAGIVLSKFVLDDVTRWLGPKEKTFGGQPVLYVCHADHNHDRVFAENISDYMASQGVACKSMALSRSPQRPELRRCFNEEVSAVLGFNSQLDHSWIGWTNFLDAAAKHQIPVIQWILDHPSSRLLEFKYSTPSNSRFLLSSRHAERYFNSYGIPGASTATVACVGPSRHSRADELSAESFIQRPISCMVAMNLRRIGGTIEDARRRIAALPPPLSQVVNDTTNDAYYDVVHSLESHFDRHLDAAGMPICNRKRHACMQMVEEVVQISRRQKIFEVARDFPILIQSDKASREFQTNATARFEENVDMALTWSRLQQTHAQVCISNMHDMVHDRILNGLNAGCVNIVEDSFANRKFFEHGRNALFFRYDDDSLRECLSLVFNDPETTFKIAAAGFSMRDDPPFRFGNFENILSLAVRQRQPSEVNLRNPAERLRSSVGHETSLADDGN
jgi:hypothetical protein